jgi:hypothetical protein
MHNRNRITMVGSRNMRRMNPYNDVLLMALAVIALTFIHEVNADVPFLSRTAATFSTTQARQLVDKKADAVVLTFGVVTAMLPRGGSSKEDDDEDNEGYDEEEANLTIDEEEEGFVDAVEAGFSEEAADDEPFVDTVAGFEGEDASEELDDNEQALLGEAEVAAPVEVFEEDEEEHDDVFVDSIVEEEETMTTQEEVPLEDRMAASMATTDDESSAFVDRMELADAYDEGETTTGGMEDSSPAAIAHGGGDDDGDGGMPSAPASSEEVATNAAPVEEIAKEMKKILRKTLKYTAKEVEAMRPEIADYVVAKNVLRPDEGMPPNFYKKGMVPSPQPKLFKKALKAVVAVAAVGAAAFFVSDSGVLDLDNFDVDVLLNWMGQLPAAIAGVPAVLASMVPSIKIGPASEETASVPPEETTDAEPRLTRKKNPKKTTMLIASNPLHMTSRKKIKTKRGWTRGFLR